MCTQSFSGPGANTRLNHVLAPLGLVYLILFVLMCFGFAPLPSATCRGGRSLSLSVPLFLSIPLSLSFSVVSCSSVRAVAGWSAPPANTGREEAPNIGVASRLAEILSYIFVVVFFFFVFYLAKEGDGKTCLTSRWLTSKGRRRVAQRCCPLFALAWLLVISRSAVLPPLFVL